MRTIPVLAKLLAGSVGFCQTPAKEPDTLQALLVEVHQLRQDIKTMTSASQRVQIALYGLQIQDVAVARATQRLDSTRNKCLGADGNRRHTAADIQRMEDLLAAEIITGPEIAAIKQRLPDLKSALEVQTAELQTCQAAEAEASSQLRNDQAKLIDLQDRITRLDKALEQTGATGNKAP